MLSFLKHAFSVTVLGWAVLLATAPVSFAQSRTGELKASIPFPFVVANQTLPAGKYTITPLGETVFRIHGAGNLGALVHTHSTERTEPASATKMVFRRYRDTQLLSEIWIVGNRIGRQVFVPAAKKEAESQKTVEVAVLLSTK